MTIPPPRVGVRVEAGPKESSACFYIFIEEEEEANRDRARSNNVAA